VILVSGWCRLLMMIHGRIETPFYS
jgi:hypothetical protein